MENIIFSKQQDILEEAQAAGKALQAWTYQQQQRTAAAERQEELRHNLQEAALHGSWAAFQDARSAKSKPIKQYIG